MAFMGTKSASSSSSSSSSSSAMRGWTYDVFLSFRGTDTRKNFTDHLYAALNQNGIFTFRDDEKLERGKIIAPELLKAIEESKFAVVVLSRDYASSSWCLTELAKIVECIEKDMIVLPIFYHVDPSDVQYQRGTFAEAFAKHEKRFKDNILDTWRAALAKVAKISGIHLQDQHESKVIKEMVETISRKLASRYLTVHKDLVGINSRMEELVNLLGMELNDVRFIGIWGMGGMGKTTLARVVYDRFRHDFDGSSFLYYVREKSEKDGLVSVQKQLLSDILIGKNIYFSNVQWGINVIRERLCRKRVLIILDDVDQHDQLEVLAGKQSWFGKGSRIIITTRDQHLLIKHQLAKAQIYELKGLNIDEALNLFCRKAFQKDHPLEGYEELSKKFICYAQGLPLALKVLGSFLLGRSPNLWESALGRLKENPTRDILTVLQISFDGLEEIDKDIFLDIACFFKGEEKSHVTNILQSLYDKQDIDIDVLLEKSLITISSGVLHMHDLLQELGREIVRRESPQEAGGRSRLWHSEDVLHVLKDSTGTKLVKGILFLNSPPRREKHLNAEAFSKMKNLGLLKISNVKLPEGLNYLSSNLRFIHWFGYPLESMPTSFEADKLVELHMRCSLIKKLWKGTKSFDKLKLIDLSNSQNLIETPNFSRVSNLEQLILQGCTRLSKIHASLGNLKRLIHLDLNGCKFLESLPHKINLESLEVFILSGCSRLKKFPEIMGNMPRLSELYLNETAIKDLPLSVEHLTGLVKLDLRDCKNLSSLPNVNCRFSSLKTLTLSGCSKLDELPEHFGNLEGLEELDVSGTAITGLPSSVVLLKNLHVLSFRGCEGLSSKSSNKLLSFSLMRRNPDPMGTLLHTLSSLCSMTNLDLSYCNLQAIPDVLGCLPSLQHLNLTGNNFVCLPKSIIRLSNLQEIFFNGCTVLRSVPELPLNIKSICANGCTSLETLSVRREDDFHPTFRLLNCIKLIDNQAYGDIVLTMLRRFFQSAGDVTIPGSEIPKWFSHQSVGASMKFLEGRSDFKGIAVCAVYVRQQSPPFSQGTWRMQGLQIYCLCNVGNLENRASGLIYLEKHFVKIDSYHLWLRYLPFKDFSSEWKMQVLNGFNANGFVEIDVRFVTEGLGLEVTKCGARLVYDKDIEDLKQNMGGCSFCNITPYEDDLDDSTKDTKIKRNRDEYDGEELAGPSGEAGTSKSNDVDVPHPKRKRLPSLIERFIPGVGNWMGILAHNDKETDCEEGEEESQ